MDAGDLKQRWGGWTLISLLLAFYLVCRVPGLRDFPVYADEATYLRWGQMIWEDPGRNFFVSMEDAKLPVHYWLLALARPIFSDPVLGGRWVSVVCGALTVLMMLPLARELGRLTEDKQNGLPLGPVLALFMICNPLVAFYQRMALAESLLLLESTLLAWASLRFARRVGERGIILRALGLGALWGVLLLTKQNFSYVLWILPVAAMGLWWRGWPRGRRFLGGYGVATLLGLALFVPVLFVSDTLPLSVRVFYKSEFASSAALPRWQIFLGNIFTLISPRSGGAPQWWPHDPARMLDEGTLYQYLTPAVFLLALAAPVVLRRRWRGMVFVLLWAGVLLGALAVNSNMVRTRYAFLGIAPVVLLAGLAGAEMLRWRRWGVAVVATVLAWPLCATVVTNVDYAAPTMMAGDRSEYLGSSCAGAGAQRAVAWLEAEARNAPVTVVTGTGFGIEHDLMWLRLRDNENVQLVATDSAFEGSGEYCVEQWFARRRARVEIASGRAVYQVVAVSEAGGRLEARPGVETYGRHARLVTVFGNEGLVRGKPATAGVGIVRLD